MQAFGIVRHLLGALRRAIGRVLLWFILGGVITALVVEAVAYFATGHHLPPQPLTNVAAAVMALVVAYAAALTVVVGEVIHFMITTVETAERDVQQQVSTGEKVVGALVQGIENLEKR